MDRSDDVPARLKTILHHHTSGGARAQKSIEWPRDRWLTWFPEHAHILRNVPAELDRAAVRTMAETPASRDDALAGFLAAMVWGFGRAGYGPWRVRQALDRHADLPDTLLRAAKAAQDDPVTAYRILAESRPTRIGPAFGTKFLHFSVPSSDSSPLILDRIVADWCREHADLRFNPVPWSPAVYERYLDRLRNWARYLGVMPDVVEELMFRDKVDGQWRDPLIG